jgi:hypothetical protein
VEGRGVALPEDEVNHEALFARTQHPDLACVDPENRRGLELGKLGRKLRALVLQLRQRDLLGPQ